jgi:transcription antitermination factor NusG
MSDETFHYGASGDSSRIGTVCAALENPKNNQQQQVRGWGGPRENSGGPRENSGGPRENSGGFRPGSGRKPKAIEPVLLPEPEGERWYCVCTDPGKDLTADIETRLAGFLVFAPTIWKPATKIRRDVNGVVRRGLPDRIEPLFRRYFFTRFDRTDFSWTKILHLPGVRRIISSTLGFPIAVPDSFIDTLQGFDRTVDGVRYVARPNGCIYPEAPSSAPKLAAGTRVKPLEGAFVDMVGELAEMSDRGRVKVLLQMFGAQRAVEMDQAAVEVVG